MRIISIIISALLLLGVFTACNSKNALESESITTTDDEIIEEGSSYQEPNMVDTGYGSWEKAYFDDEFGETDYSNPFMSLYIRGKSREKVDLCVLYRPSGTFAFKLFEYNGRLVRDIYSSKIIMTIRVNGQDIGPVYIPVNKDEFRVYGEDSQALSTIFNEGSFSISLRDEGYLEDYHYVFNVNEPKGSFEKAVTNLLNSEYRGI